ncbi:TIGR03905 family TSCPD domain-containing protein [Parabacteroides pacaensis]|uniref:TIGR03905 family TSCPD domain-containing protein n=1 Tax=Parabacteroides pacaensis TaxID=2086575 RepID=UPI000D10C4DC|nr:TIGR03905 family TSCPD domain-containing protein [Parabacteroides pacaensis]
MEKQRISYVPTGVCSKMFVIDAEGGRIKNLQVIGGCEGNLRGLSTLLIDMKIEDAIKKLEGIDCHEKGTSCPDQIAKALRQFSVS